MPFGGGSCTATQPSIVLCGNFPTGFAAVKLGDRVLYRYTAMSSCAKFHRSLEVTRPSVCEMYEVGSSGGGRERNKREREKEERGKRRELSARAFAIARSAHVGSVRPSVGRAGGRRVSRGLPPLFLSLSLSLHVARSSGAQFLFRGAAVDSDGRFGQG